VRQLLPLSFLHTVKGERRPWLEVQQTGTSPTVSAAHINYSSLPFVYPSESLVSEQRLTLFACNQELAVELGVIQLILKSDEGRAGKKF
jgi:hypothetical protein